MSTFERLPVEILENIVGLALDLVASHNIIRSGQLVAPNAPSLFGKAFAVGKEVFESTLKVREVALPLRLSCKTLNSVTDNVIFSRSVFYCPNDETLEWFLDTLELSNQLCRVKHMFVVLYSNSGYDGWDNINFMDEFASEVLIRKGTHLLSRLPTRLLSLELQPPDDKMWPSYCSAQRAHPLLVEALGRFTHIRDLRLDFYDNWLHLDLFCAAAASFRLWPGFEGPLLDPRKGDVNPPPRFPALRHLYLRGCIIENVHPEHLIKAFSQQQMPALQSLHFDGLLYAAPHIRNYSGPKTCFTPEVLESMAPLREFVWINYDFEKNLRKTEGDPHAPPMISHLQALKRRHQSTLEVLELDYTGWTKGYWVEWDLSKEYLTAFVDNMPKLNNVIIEVPQLDMKLRRTGGSFAGN